jgi:putative tricarboxylic transport membrane protein
MDATRRAFVGAAALCASVGPAIVRAWAQDPGRVAGLNLLVPSSPGGGWDGTAQAMAKALRETGAVPEVRIEYLPGAGGALALPRLVTGLRGQPDILMVGGLTLVSSPIVYQSALTLLDTFPVARLVGEPLVIAVPAGSPLRTIADFARALRADPLGLRVAGGSEGGADHILLAMVTRELGIDAFGLAYLPFSGGGGLAAEAVLDGRARAGISNWSEFAPHIEAGRLRALALSGDARYVGVDVPTLREGGIDVVLYNWNGVFAPPGIGEQQRARLDALIAAMVRSPAWEREAQQRRWRVLYLPRREFEAFLRTEMRSVEATIARLGLGQPRQPG